MQLVSTPGRRRRLVSLTPLIDVVFILLLFFMLASQFHHWRALTVQATGTSDDGAAPSMLVSVHGDGTLNLNGEPTSPTDLIVGLHRALAKEPELRVQIESADEVPLQTLVTLLDQLHATGIERMSLR